MPASMPLAVTLCIYRWNRPAWPLPTCFRPYPNVKPPVANTTENHSPPEWVDWVIASEEEKASFLNRPVAKPGHEAELKKRTLSNLYNARPAWLNMAHKQLDQAVAVASGWSDYMPEMPAEDILCRLLALNLNRAARPAST